MIASMARDIPYFAYGTLQVGFPNHGRFVELLGDRIGRARTVEAYAIVVPKRPACSNPGCPLLHRMAALVPGVEPFRVDGDLFMLEPDALAELDRLEGCSDGALGPYVRGNIDVVALDGAGTWRATGYPAREPGRWRALLDRGGAEASSEYQASLSAETTSKPCCVRAPGHAGPHDVVDPLGLD
jgi:gamma-glutamylcyclotransferase (GGCT)/AIG2-like uncharacterized protein YtfP